MPPNDAGVTPTIVTGWLFDRDDPAGDLRIGANRRRQNAWLMTATAGAPGLGRRLRQRPTAAPQAEHPEVGASDAERRRDVRLAVDDDVESANRRGGEEVRERPVRLAQGLELGNEKVARTFWPWCGALNPYSLELRIMSFCPAQLRRTSVAGSGTGSACSSTPLTAVNSAVFAPMPSIRERSTTVVQPFVRSGCGSRI